MEDRKQENRRKIRNAIGITMVILFLVVFYYTFGTMYGTRGYYLGYARSVFVMLSGFFLIVAFILGIKRLIAGFGKQRSYSNAYQEDLDESGIEQTIKTIVLILLMGITGVLFLLVGVAESTLYYADKKYLDKPKEITLYDYSVEYKFSMKGPDNYWLVGVDESGEEYKFDMGDSSANQEFMENDSCIVRYLPHSKTVMEAYSYKQ